MADLRTFFRRVLERSTTGGGSLCRLGMAELFRGRFVVAVWLAPFGRLHVDVLDSLYYAATREDVAEVQAAMRDTFSNP